jgi:predicted negative regulator of RcsB-dependent stress response
MRRRFALPTISLVLAGLALASPEKHAYASRHERAEFIQLAQTPGDVIACRSSPTRHCILELALAALEEIDEESAAYHALVAISEAQAKAADFEAAAATMDRTGVLYSKPSPRVSLARLMAEAGRYDAARAMAEGISDADDRALAFLEIGEIATRAGRADLAENAFEASLAIAASLPNGRQARDSILQLSESWARAAAVAAERHITPVVRRAISAANTDAEREESIAVLAAVYALAGNIDAAFTAFRSLHDADLSARVQIRIARAQARSGNLVGARATLNAALARLDHVQDRDSRDVIRSRAAEFLAANGNVSAAVAMVDAMEGGFFRAQWLMLMAHEISTMPNTGSAREEIAAVLRATEKMDDAQMRALTLWSAAGVQAKIGDVTSARANVAAALATVGRIEEASLRAMVYGNFGAMLAREGYRDESQAAFDDALMTADKIVDVGGLGGREMALLSIARNQAEVGNIAAARSTIERDVDHRWRNIVLVSIAEAQAKAGKVRDALASAYQIEDPRSRVDAFSRIANQLSQ